MANYRNDTKAKEMYDLYCKGFSLGKVAEAFGVTRQSIYKMFKRRNYILRSRARPLPFVFFNGNKYTLRNNGYYGQTSGNRTLLHRDVWKKVNGKIPPGFDLHHIDGNRSHNDIQNLEIYSKSEHASKFNTGRNQYSPK